MSAATVLDKSFCLLVTCHCPGAEKGRDGTGRLAELVRCVESALAAVDAGQAAAGPRWRSIDVVVVDDHSPAPISDLLPPPLLQRLEVLRNAGPPGQGGALNDALARTAYDVYGFTDSDCTLAAGWFATLAESYLRDPGQAGCAGPNWMFRQARGRWRALLTRQESRLMEFMFQAYVEPVGKTTRIDCRNLSIQRWLVDALGGLGLPAFAAGKGPGVSGQTSYVWRPMLALLDRQITFCSGLAALHAPVRSLRAQVAAYFRRGRLGDFDLLYAGGESLGRVFRSRYLVRHFLRPWRQGGVHLAYVVLLHGAFWLGILRRHRARRKREPAGRAG
jgi:hypothetical protein